MPPLLSPRTVYPQSAGAVLAVSKDGILTICTCRPCCLQGRYTHNLHVPPLLSPRTVYSQSARAVLAVSKDGIPTICTCRPCCLQGRYTHNLHVPSLLSPAGRPSWHSRAARRTPVTCNMACATSCEVTAQVLLFGLLVSVGFCVLYPADLVVIQYSWSVAKFCVVYSQQTWL